MNLSEKLSLPAEFQHLLLEPDSTKLIPTKLWEIWPDLMSGKKSILDLTGEERRAIFGPPSYKSDLTGWTRDIAKLMFDHDQDPHGVFEFVDFITVEEVKQRYAKANQDYPSDDDDAIDMELIFGQYVNAGGEIIEAEPVLPNLKG